MSRKLTSGFDFWSRGHLRMAVMHLPVKFGAEYLYPVRSYLQHFVLSWENSYSVQRYLFYVYRKLIVKGHRQILKSLIYLYPVRSYWHFSEIQDGGRRHHGFSYYVNLAIRVCWQCGICVLYQIGLKYMQWLLRSTHLCFRCSFDDVTRINFRFRLLVAWSSPHGRDASSCKIWCSYRYPVTFFRNSIWRPPPSWIFRLCEFGHFGVLIVWY